MIGRITFNSDSKIIIVYAEIRSGEKVIESELALDTGATYVMIPKEIAETLGIQPDLSEERIEIITASGVEKVPIVILESMKVAGSEAKNIKAVVHDLPAKSYVDGLLGLSFLRNFNVKLNFKDGVLEID